MKTQLLDTSQSNSALPKPKETVLVSESNAPRHRHSLATAIYVIHKDAHTMFSVRCVADATSKGHQEEGDQGWACDVQAVYYSTVAGASSNNGHSSVSSFLVASLRRAGEKDLGCSEHQFGAPSTPSLARSTQHVALTAKSSCSEHEACGATRQPMYGAGFDAGMLQAAAEATQRQAVVPLVTAGVVDVPEQVADATMTTALVPVTKKPRSLSHTGGKLRLDAAGRRVELMTIMASPNEEVFDDRHDALFPTFGHWRRGAGQSSGKKWKHLFLFWRRRNPEIVSALMTANGGDIEDETQGGECLKTFVRDGVSNSLLPLPFLPLTCLPVCASCAVDWHRALSRRTEALRDRSGRPLWHTAK